MNNAKHVSVNVNVEPAFLTNFVILIQKNKGITIRIKYKKFTEMQAAAIDKSIRGNIFGNSGIKITVKPILLAQR